MYTVKQVAAELGANEETIRRWLRDGKINGFMPGGQKLGYRIPSAEVERLLTGGVERLPQPAVGAERRAAARRAALEQAERARARGDDEGAERFETIAAGMPH